MRRRVLAVVDTDSFVKWGANLLNGAPNDWDLELVSITTRASASARQVEDALAGSRIGTGSVTALTLPELLERVHREPVDAVLVSTLGPVAEVIIGEITRTTQPRPVFITGLPGISIPPKWKGVFLRAQADLFVLGSRREVREYAELAEEHEVVPHFGLAALPFLEAARATPRRAADRIVFAAQPSVPSAREDREKIVGWLVATADEHPDLRVVVKTRARAGERQTHHEEFPYEALLPADRPRNLVVESGPMSEQLARAVGLVTISSTAVIEAIAFGVPSLVLTDFGIERRLINEVFEDSGLYGDHADLVAGRFNDVREQWRDENYFHPAGEDDWIERATRLMELRDAGILPDRPPARRSRGGALRRAWERKLALGPHDRSRLGYVALALGMPIRVTKQTVRRVVRTIAPSPEMPADATSRAYATRGSALLAPPAPRHPDSRPPSGSDHAPASL